jgi:excisionase family DNA binding protein
MAKAHQRRDEDWLFECENCNCMFSHAKSQIACPRCSEILTSYEQGRPQYRSRLLTAKEAAKALAMSMPKLIEMCECSEINLLRNGSSIRIEEADLSELMELCKIARREPGPRQRKIPNSRPRLRFHR